MSDISIDFVTRKRITGNVPQAAKDIQRARFLYRLRDASGTWPIHAHSEAAVIRVANSEIAKPSVCLCMCKSVCVCMNVYIYIYTHTHMCVCVCVCEKMERIFTYVIHIRAYIAKVYMYAMCQLYRQHRI
jgi:hypothetical protein